MNSSKYVDFSNVGEDGGFVEIATEKCGHIISYSRSSMIDLFENDFTIILRYKINDLDKKQGILCQSAHELGDTGLFYEDGIVKFSVYRDRELFPDQSGPELFREVPFPIPKKDEGDVLTYIVKNGNKIKISNGTIGGHAFHDMEVDSVYKYSKDQYSNLLIGAANIFHNEHSSYFTGKMYMVAIYKEDISDDNIRRVTYNMNLEKTKNGLNLESNDSYMPDLYYNFGRYSDSMVEDASGNGNAGMTFNIEIKDDKVD